MLALFEVAERMAADAAAVGLDFQWQALRGGNSYDAHRLTHLARALGREDEVTALRARVAELEAADPSRSDPAGRA